MRKKVGGGFGWDRENLLSQRSRLCSCVSVFLVIFCTGHQLTEYMVQSHLSNSSMVFILRIVHVILITGLCFILFIIRTK